MNNQITSKNMILKIQNRNKPGECLQTPGSL